MVDRGKARDLNEAARRFAETLADSYRVVYGQAAESGAPATSGPGVLRVGGQQPQREQAEGGRSSAQRLLEQADRQQEVGRALAQESVGAYMDFLDATFSQYRAGAMASEQTAAGVLGAVTGATARTRDAAAEGAQGPRRRPPSR